MSRSGTPRPPVSSASTASQGWLRCCGDAPHLVAIFLRDLPALLGGRARYRAGGSNERLEHFGDDREFPYSTTAEPAGPQFMRGHQLIECTRADMVDDPCRVLPVRV